MEKPTELWPIYDLPDQIKNAHKDRRKAFAEKYPFSRLEPGKCFIVKEGQTTLQNMQTLCNHHSKKRGKQFKCWTDDVSGTNDIVVWRES